jgi:hypothetical protein
MSEKAGVVDESDPGIRSLTDYLQGLPVEKQLETLTRAFPPTGKQAAVRPCTLVEARRGRFIERLFREPNKE